MEPLTLFALASSAVSLSASLFGLGRARRETRQAHADARTDPLTGVGNKRAWQESVELMRARGQPFSFVLFDVANLKAMNEALGHERADVVLAEIGSLFRSNELQAARIGGDEFVLLVSGDEREAIEARDRIERQTGTRDLPGGVLVFIVGAVGFWAPGDDLCERMTACDHALEERKADRKRTLGLPVSRAETLARLAA